MKQKAAESPNIILITIDALRHDHLGCYGYYRDTSPNIDSLAAKGVKFLEAISNGGHTSAAFPPMMASAPPPLEQKEGKAILDRGTTVAELFRKAGYQTAAFHSNPLLSHFYGYDKGFDMFDDSFRQLKPWHARIWIRTIVNAPGGWITKTANKAILMLKPILRLWSRPITSAEEINSKSISWLKTHNEKFFLWLHYMDVHHPYIPPAEYLRQFCDQPVSRRQMQILYQKTQRRPDELSQSDIEILINLYDAEIKYTDDFIGRLLDKLENHLTNTLMIVTADHGDEFGEHGKFGHETVYDGLLRVPLIIAGPGINSGTVVKQQVSLIDLSPTIAELAGISGARSFQGKSLIPVIEGKEEAVTGTISTTRNHELGQRAISFRTTGWKYIRTESFDDGHILAEELYDLRNDPGETKNLHGEHNVEATKFELKAKDRIAQFKQSKVKGATDYEKQRIKARLSKLDRL